MTAYEKLKQIFIETKIPFEESDDSRESSIDEEINTVLIVKDENVNEHIGHQQYAYFFFTRNGEFKEFNIA